MTRRFAPLSSLVVGILVFGLSMPLWLDVSGRDVGMPVVSILLALVAATLLWTRRTRMERQEGEGWTLVAGALVCWAVAIAIQALGRRHSVADWLFNPQDVFFLAGSLLGIVGLIRLPCRDVRVHARSVGWLDLGIAGISAGSLFWHLVLVPGVHQEGAPNVVRLFFSLLFPIPKRPRLWSWRRRVVRPNPARPTTAGLPEPACDME